MLLVSDLPEIVWHLAGGRAPAWLLGAKVAALCLFLGSTLAWRALQPLRPYAVVLLVLFGALGATAMVRDTAWFQRSFNKQGVSFVVDYLALYVLDTGVALAVIAALWFLKRHRSEFFLVVGDLDAPIERVRWLGIRGGELWTRFAFIFAFAAGLCVLIPTVLVLRPSPDTLLRALPLLPAVILFSAVNAFTEEVYFRASFLATLQETIGRAHTLLITIVFFGLAHYLHGSPPGIMGAAMTGFLAYLLGKSMLETKGMLWAWFIHFVPDVVVFASYAILFVRK
jgi:membrane protease YdiL (CAAX protease family)